MRSSPFSNREGPERAHYLLEKLVDKARRSGAYIPFSSNTALPPNTIPVHMESARPATMPWRSASARPVCDGLVAKANQVGHELAVTSQLRLGRNSVRHRLQSLWHAPHKGHGGDLVYFQGHSSPGIYARAFLEGKAHRNAAPEFSSRGGWPGLSPYPHPWLMPDFGQFPTVSMGLGRFRALQWRGF